MEGYTDEKWHGVWNHSLHFYGPSPTASVRSSPPRRKPQSRISVSSHPFQHVHHLLTLGTKHNLSFGSHRVKKSLSPFNHSISPCLPFLPSFFPSSSFRNPISNVPTTFATTTFISIIAKYFPAQTVLPILNGRYALRSLTISGRLVHRSGTHSCGFSKYRSSCCMVHVGIDSTVSPGTK